MGTSGVRGKGKGGVADERIVVLHGVRHCIAWHAFGVVPCIKPEEDSRMEKLGSGIKCGGKAW